MRYFLKYSEYINIDYLLDLIDIGFEVFVDSDDRLSLRRKTIGNKSFIGNVGEIGEKYVDISHFLNIKSCYDGRWCITLHDVKIDGSHGDYYFNNALKSEHSVLPDFILKLLNISIDTSIKVIYANNLVCIEELRISSRPLQVGDASFTVEEVVQFIFKK